jgi:hypothetical protein
MTDKVSLIIPSRDDDIKLFSRTLDAVTAQEVLPSEVIVIDSSQSNQIQDLLSKHHLKHLIQYRRIKPSFAGLSTNIGFEMANYELIALLDTKTTPDQSWLKEYLRILKNESTDIVFGSTFFCYSSDFQRAVRAASYGAIAHETVPGSLFYKKIAQKLKFKENLRAGYDIDWRENVKNHFSWFTPEEGYITYKDFPSSILGLIKKYTIYSFHTGFISSQNRLKDLYFSLMLIITALIIPRWNLMLDGWDQNSLFIPDITKKYFLSLLILFLIALINSMFFDRNLKNSLGYKTLKLLVFIFILYSVFRWNAEIALWAEDAALYIPHITKIFILLLFSISITLRGIIKPITKKEGWRYLFPFKWLKVGFLGLVMDLSKMPGFIFGSIVGRLRRFKP